MGSEAVNLVHAFVLLVVICTVLLCLAWVAICSLFGKFTSFGWSKKKSKLQHESCAQPSQPTTFPESFVQGANFMTEYVELVTALRPRCKYYFVDSEPLSGQWWAVKLVPVKFPGPHRPTTYSGGEVFEFCVISAQKDEDGLWAWVYLSATAKEMFGMILVQNHAEPSKWYYIVEIPDWFMEHLAKSNPLEADDGTEDSTDHPGN